MTEFPLRCTRCGWDQFKLTAVMRGDDRPVGDIKVECLRCGGIEQPGYLPDVDPQLEPSREPIGEKIWRASDYK